MNRKVSILLLFCLIAPVTLTFFILKSQKIQVVKEVKRRMIDGMDNEELVLLKFTEVEKQTKLNWKHSREFEYLGEMYDIVKIEVKGDTTYYRCFHDHEETKINKQLDHLFSIILGKDSKNQDNIVLVFKFFIGLYFSEPIEKNITVFKGIKCEHLFKEHFYQSLPMPPPVPPPEIG